MSKEGRYFTQVKELDCKCYLMKRGAQHLWSDVHWHPRGEGGRKERGGVGGGGERGEGRGGGGERGEGRGGGGDEDGRRRRKDECYYV